MPEPQGCLRQLGPVSTHAIIIDIVIIQLTFPDL